jgi:ribosomal protein S18 acetylase RimI-like enzyme
LAILIERLGKHHDRTKFSCGNAELDNWFSVRASQDERRNVARVFVATDVDTGVIGFYSLSSFTLSLDSLPETMRQKLPRYDAIPAALIGRLARDTRVRGRGIGELLLADAVKRILSASETIAVFAIVVDAKDDVAVRFYRAFGFLPFPATLHRLFLPISVVMGALDRTKR